MAFPKFVFYHKNTPNMIWIYQGFAEMGENNNTRMKRIDFENEIAFLNDLRHRGWTLM
jgi:hypothetical protein